MPPEVPEHSFQKTYIIWLICFLFYPLLGLSQEKSENFSISTSYSPGIEVALGEEVKIEAQGRIMLGFFAGATTPGGIDGYRSYNIDPSSKHGALLYKIGNGPFTAMNAPSITFKSKNAGPLYFQVNDNDPSNNSGHFKVKVSVYSASSLATNKNFRKKGFVYKSDQYWSRLGSNKTLQSIFEGDFSSIFKDENFESLFTAFVENYSKKCESNIPGNTEVKIRTTESGTDAYGSRYSNTYISHTFKVDPMIADIFTYYLNKQDANGVSDLIGVFANRSSSPTAGDLIAGTFQQPVNALISMRNFFNAEPCDSATMNQMRDNFYRFALDRNSVQQDNILIVGAEKESHN